MQTTKTEYDTVAELVWLSCITGVLRPIKDRCASLRNVLVILCEMHISESCGLVSFFVIDPAVVE